MSTTSPFLGYSEIFDISYLQEVTGGDPSLIQSLVMLFVEETAQRLLHLEEALQNKQHEIASREAHTLKGSCSQLGEGSLHQAAIALEVAVRNKDDAEQTKQILRFQQEFEKLRQALRNV